MLKQKNDLEALIQAETEAAFQDGVDKATKNYNTQVEEISSYLFEQGGRAALKKAGISEDHPVYKDPPKFSTSELELSYAPSSSEAPLEDILAPPCEAPPENAAVDTGDASTGAAT